MAPPGFQRVKTGRIVDHLVAAGLIALPENPALAKVCLQGLGSLTGDRALFATCLLTLELALLKDPEAREALPRHVGVLLEAHGDARIANVLMAGNPELERRWQRIRPVVADFVALRRRPPERSQGEPASTQSSEEIELELDIEEDTSEERLATPTELIEDIQVILEVEAETADRPPPSPAPGAVEAGVLSAPSAPEPDEPEMRAFWSFVEKALGRQPDPSQPMLAPSFVVARSTDRAHLVRFAHDLVARFPQVRQARTLAALTLLYVACHEKERGLLGVNRERVKLLRSGLSMLGDRRAAAQVAVFFEADGPDTRRSFAQVVDLIAGYAGFCAREQLDPLLADSAARFVGR